MIKSLKSASVNYSSTIETVIKRLGASREICYDAETSGLDWKRNHTVGHVITFGPHPDDSHYLPFRHAAGGNLFGLIGPQTKDSWDKVIYPAERELIRTLSQVPLIFGHNLAFDLKFLSQLPFDMRRPRFEDTMINAPLLDEWQGKYSLAYCANLAGVEAKKVEIIRDHIRSLFSEATDKDYMGHYWRLAGNDPIAVDYAAGDGTTTWQLRDWQMPQISEQGLQRVHDVESRLIPVLARMSIRGIRVDEDRLTWLQVDLNRQIDELLSSFPPDFNARSSDDVRKWCTDHGATDWPMTQHKTNPKPSFPEQWLETNEPGRQIVAVRRLTTLRDSFVMPMIETHLFNGRVHTEFNQLRSDDYGTVTGRLSSSNPNLQQVPKRNKTLGRLFRSIFVPDKGMTLGSADYRQCLAAGTQISIPGGIKNIEDIKVGDWVYSYDNSRRLVLRRVTRSGKTGKKPLVRVHWKTQGRTKGYLDLTADHPIRLSNGTYKTPAELSMLVSRKLTRGWPYWISVLAVRRKVSMVRNYPIAHLYTTGDNRIKESRLVFEQVYGWLPEEVHHRDENPLNNDPDNLEGLTKKEHRARHGMMFGMGKLTSEERIIRSRHAIEGLRRKFKLINNHAITHIEPLIGVHPVYDITVDDTHNFIANEICVHNCEPVLLAYYSRCKALIDGFTAIPPVDPHQAVANATGRDRDTGKRCNQLIITGGGPKAMSRKFGIPLGDCERIFADYFRAMPEVKTLQKRAARKFRERGYLLSLLERRARLHDRDKDYTGMNRLLQCGNADIIKSAMVRIDDYLESEGRPEVYALLNIHDDLLHQFSEDARRHYRECLRIMADFGPGAPIELDLPLGVDPGEGSDWAISTYGPEK